MKTKVHVYSFNTARADERREYDALCAELRATLGRGKCMKALGTYYHTELAGVTVELETAYVFGNQWNTAPVSPGDEGMRLFDWAEECLDNEAIKRGHYLDITDEMRDIRANTLHCGYCGALYSRPELGHEPASVGNVIAGALFCDRCLDSEYLKESEIHLLRLLPVEAELCGAIHATIGECPKRESLTDAEAAELLPKYCDAQIHGSTERGRKRIAKQRADIEAEYQKHMQTTTDKRAGLLWLMDHGVSLDNVIFYNHTGRFSFGWRTPLSEGIKSALLDILCEFPFDYDIIDEAAAAKKAAARRY